MGCHGPPVPILHVRVHPDPALRRHHSCRPYPPDQHRQRGPPGWRRGHLPLPPRHPPAGIRAGTGIPGIRPIPATVPPHQLRRRQPPDYGHPPPRPRERRATNDHRKNVRHSPAHHNLPGRLPTPGAPRQIGQASRPRDPRPQHPERRTPTPGGHHNPRWSHTGHAAPPHRTPKQGGRAPRPATPTCQGGPPVYAGPGILHGSGAQRSHRVPSPAPPAPPRRPTPHSTASDRGMGATRRLAHVFPRARP